MWILAGALFAAVGGPFGVPLVVMSSFHAAVYASWSGVGYADSHP